MNCIKCGQLLLPGSKYCPYCGEGQPFSSEFVFCSNCGNKVVCGSICPFCGNKAILPQMQSVSFSNPVQTRLPVKDTVDSGNLDFHNRAILRPLANGITARNVLWIIIGGLQISAGLLVMLLADLIRTVRPFSMWVYFGMGIINLIVGIVGLVYANKVRNVRVSGQDILDECSFLGAISNYIWNSLMIIGLVISLNVISAIFLLLVLAALIVDLVAVRIYAIKYRKEIIKIHRIRIGGGRRQDE